MNKKLIPNEWRDEFISFTNAKEITPPSLQTNIISDQVHKDLCPSFFSIFKNLIGIHAIVGSLTLLICPQFGIAPFIDIGLMNIFMKFGEVACMFSCGAFYMGSSILVASIALKPEQIKALRRTEFLQFFLLSTFSMGIFICFGPSAILNGLTLFWLLGSVLGGIASLELGLIIRKQFIHVTN